MSTVSSAVRWLSILLSLVALHSAVVGLVLIVAPPSMMEAFGYAAIAEPFFKTQGGVFHIVMAVAYALAALDPKGRRTMVAFTIAAKMIATVFLVVYYAVVSAIPVILASAAGDFLMGVLLLLLFRTVTRRSPSPG
jgi:amino acid permease